MAPRASVPIVSRPSLGSGLPSIAPSGPEILHEGWVLKKRRKKMQGFARRYFTLYKTGLLSYSFEPGQAVRDHISLHHAAISTAPGRKDIHIDSDTATFHIKCLSTEEFDQWMTAFRRFITLGSEARRSASARVIGIPGNKSGPILEEMGSSLVELESAIIALQETLVSKAQKSQSLNRKGEKERVKDHSKEGSSVFGLFKKCTHSVHVDPHPDQPSPHVQRLYSILETLKSQHSSLKPAYGHVHLDGNPPVHGSPLPSTEEEEESPELAINKFSTPLTRRSNRASVATTVSDSVNEWFDALEDGPQEFIMDVESPQDGAGIEQQPSQIQTNDSHSTVDDGSSIDTDMEDDRKTAQNHPERTDLPPLHVGDEGSLFAILKKNVGKDLSTITFPVSFNEPLTLLQRAAEETEYYDLINQAAQSNDSTERMCYVAAFAVSGYAHTRHRSGRKGFNPMLAETFEDARMKFIAEKVCHNPLEMAYHAEGANWELSATSSGRTKFWGKSLEIIPLGTTRLKVGEDIFEWKKPSSFMRNIMVGTKYLEHCGDLTIDNIRDGSRCVLEFKQTGYWGASNVVSGTVCLENGTVACQLEGKWDDQISQMLDTSHFRVLWRMHPFPKNTHEYYGFTSFGITLNEITSDIAGKLPPTDSRYRPDVRALENGDLDTAEGEKLRVEEVQRERRRRGEDRTPRWFKQVGGEWVYVGGYWEARQRGWKGEGIQPLW
ncbi:Oxysterol-binding protein-domain-containing protein [Infundibulicybe gibba]|nr:Oxysterol-binding protein-domain-containing protein [Infundibulicybe gibba]